MHALTRRSLFSLLAWPAARLYSQQAPSGQGMASRGIQAAPRGKASGLPFHARFTDVASQAGLRETVVCGHPRRADYVIEAMSCGAAFLDYDNDGWQDILVLPAHDSAIRRLAPRSGSTRTTATAPSRM